MKTWTNPTVEELDVKLTALLDWADFAEYEQNGVIEPGRVFGDPDANGGENNGNTGNQGGENQGGENEGGDAFGTAS